MLQEPKIFLVIITNSMDGFGKLGSILDRLLGIPIG
jgi:hypothetical protein